MGRVKSRGTRPELALRAELERIGVFGWTANDALMPYTPDLWFPHALVAVFVDGCFWHSCPRHGSLPKTRTEEWRVKLARTAERDSYRMAWYAVNGCSYVQVWEHQDPAAAAQTVADAVRCALDRVRNPPPQAMPEADSPLMRRLKASRAA